MESEEKKAQSGKQFTVMNEDGKCYSFRMKEDATQEEAKAYAKLWNSLAGDKTRIAKVWENAK